MRWRFLAPDHWLNSHPFSLSAPPTNTSLRLTVKALGDGSRSLQHLSPGTWVIAEGPYGAVTAKRRTQRDVVLIAGDVGITPIRALFEVLPVHPGEDVILLDRARNAEELLFTDELDRIAASRSARILYLLGDNRDLLSTATLLQYAANIPSRDVYMCGPPGLTAAVRKDLHTAGLPPRQLHEERFAF